MWYMLTWLSMKYDMNFLVSPYHRYFRIGGTHWDFMSHLNPFILFQIHMLHARRVSRRKHDGLHSLVSYMMLYNILISQCLCIHFFFSFEEIYVFTCLVYDVVFIIIIWMYSSVSIYFIIIRDLIVMIPTRNLCCNYNVFSIKLTLN